MSDRDRIRRHFELETGPVPPGLEARVRGRLADPPFAGAGWIPATAAALLAVAVVASLLWFGLARGASERRPATQAPSLAPTVALATPTVALPTPALSPQPSPSPTAACVTGSTGGGGAATSSPRTVVAVRAAAHDGYDRFTIELSGAPSSVTVAVAPSTTVTLSPSGQVATLAGDSAVVVDLVGVASGSYTGPGDLKVGSMILEARRTQDFEGHMTWVLGVSSVCIRVSYLENPYRIVVDVG